MDGNFRAAACMHAFDIAPFVPSIIHMHMYFCVATLSKHCEKLGKLLSVHFGRAARWSGTRRDKRDKQVQTSLFVSLLSSCPVPPCSSTKMATLQTSAFSCVIQLIQKP
uniref:Uncharacterized protein n=1 Tax=Rhipicephalus zambeziensis TaxID=60191 RepID=A0A224Y5A3_9ACAR